MLTVNEIPSDDRKYLIVTFNVIQRLGAKIALIMTDGFYDDNFFQFTYRSKDPVRKRMGVIVLRLSEK